MHNTIHITKLSKINFINTLNSYVSGYHKSYVSHGELTFIKKYNRVKQIINDELKLLPTDLIEIIISYINEVITLSYGMHYANINQNKFVIYAKLSFDGIEPINFVLNVYDDYKYETNSIKYTLSKFTNKSAMFDEKVIFNCDHDKYNIGNTYVNDSYISFFNHFMNKYYGNKQAYCIDACVSIHDRYIQCDTYDDIHHMCHIKNKCNSNIISNKVLTTNDFCKTKRLGNIFHTLICDVRCSYNLFRLYIHVIQTIKNARLLKNVIVITKILLDIISNEIEFNKYTFLDVLHSIETRFI